MPRSDNHGGTKDADYRWALTSPGRLGLAFDAKVARHASGTRPGSLGIDVGTYRRHERQVLNLAHSQDTEPNHFTTELAQWSTTA